MLDVSLLSPEEIKTLIANQDNKISVLEETINSQASRLVEVEAAYNAAVEGNAKHQETIASLEDTIDKIEAVNENLTKHIEAAPAAIEVKKDVTSVAKVSGETFEMDGQTYGFAFAKLQHGTEVVTADEILASTELQSKLVTSGSGMIKKIVAVEPATEEAQ